MSRKILVNGKMVCAPAKTFEKPRVAYSVIPQTGLSYNQWMEYIFFDKKKIDECQLVTKHYLKS